MYQIQYNKMKNQIEITSKTNIDNLSGYNDIFITWLPNESFINILNKVIELKNKGFNPIPHIPVLKIKNKKELKFISHILSKYTNTLLLIRGSGKQEGEFNTVESVIKTGILNNFKIGVAGFPEGNGNLDYNQTLNILKQKSSYSDFVVTQWSLNKKSIKRFLDESPLPVYLGIPNKCNLKQLLKFSKLCGIENSIKYYINNSKINLLKLMINGFNPSDIINEFKNHKNLKGFHIYSFGKI